MKNHWWEQLLWWRWSPLRARSRSSSSPKKQFFRVQKIWQIRVRFAGQNELFFCWKNVVKNSFKSQTFSRLRRATHYKLQFAQRFLYKTSLFQTFKVYWHFSVSYGSPPQVPKFPGFSFFRVHLKPKKNTAKKVPKSLLASARHCWSSQQKQLHKRFHSPIPRSFNVSPP